MKTLQFIQLNRQQRSDAIEKMVALAAELDVAIFGTKDGAMIIKAIEQDANPDADFIFDEIDSDRVDVIYRENI